MKLGTLNLDNNLILAPLQNVTTAPFRRFCRTFHKIGLACVPMIYTKRLQNKPKSTEHELNKIEQERPISIQLIGNDSQSLIKSIEFLESYKFDVLDINAGCPSSRAINAKQGGYFLKDLKNLEELLKVAIKHSSRPVSLKTRLGFDNVDNLRELAKIINCSGVEFTTIHARCVRDQFKEKTLNLDAVKALRDKVNIPLVGNGDITNPILAKRFMDYTCVDAIMIGRGVMGKPEIFRQIDEYTTTGTYSQFKNTIKLMKNNLAIFEKTLNEFIVDIDFSVPKEKYRFTELKRNAIWLSKDIENSTSFRIKLSKTKDLTQLKLVLSNIFKNN